MSIRTRYFLTAAILITCLVGIVTVARAKSSVMAAVNPANAKIKGPADVPVHMVVYSDFQCPACMMASGPAEELRLEFKDYIQLEFRHYPLTQPHRWALTAALFAECAGEQGKFWEFHDRLFIEQPVWSKVEDATVLFAAYAVELGLDTVGLEQCITSPKTLTRINSERASGDRLKVQSTPTFFINGQTLVGGLQLKQNGRTIVIEELKKAGKYQEPAQV